VEQRFTDHFRVAYEAWIARGEPTQGPFKMKEYVPPGTTEAMAADQRADGGFADALVLTSAEITTPSSLWSSRCFFAAASTRLGGPRAPWILIGLAMTFLIAAAVILATFPRDI
jgi:hypothetical protein